MSAGSPASRLWLQALEAVSFLERDTPPTFGDVLNDLADRHGERPALLDDRETLSYRELANRANRCAGWAKAEGLAPGAIVALLMGNCADYVAIWAGLSQAGCTVALVNTNLTQGALVHAIRTASASAIIVETALQDRFTAIAPEMATLRCWRHGDGNGVWPRMDLAAAAQDDARPQEPPPARDAPALLVYTSGTTGLPKAANVSHARILQWSYWFAGLMGAQPEDRLYDCLPMYHSTGGISAIGAMLVRGGSVYIRPRFSAQRFWPEVAESGATIFQYIGELCRYLLQAPPHPLETRHRLRLCCGNGLRGEVWRAFEARFRIPRILEFYAATEGAVSLYNCEGRPGVIGRVPGFLAHRFPLALVRCDPETARLVRDETGQCIPCATDEVGEALGRLDPGSRSPARRFEGYTDPALSAHKLARDVFGPGDLWYRTGDLMRRDKDGFYYYVDRLGEAFRWKGENVSASEVASVIASCPGIADAVVFGVRIPGHEGRAGMAAISPKRGFSLAMLRCHLQENLPSYARPVFVRLCTAIERTGTFKLAAGRLTADGYRGAGLDHLWFDDRAAQTYVRCTADLLAQIESGATFL